MQTSNGAEQWFDSLNECSLKQWITAASALWNLQINPQNGKSGKII